MKNAKKTENNMEINFSEKQIGEFKKLDVLAIYIFGSYASGRVHSLSDVDFGILLNDQKIYQSAPMEIYQKFYEIFVSVLPKDYLKRRYALKRHDFDIVFLQEVPIGLQYEATREGIILYESDRAKRLVYEETVLKRQCDLSHVYGIFHDALMERI